jgi:phosphate uptake regulator
MHYQVGGVNIVEFRKLISFGKTSYVVSIPKTWVNRNNLKKGDTVGIAENEGNLLLTPGNAEDMQKPKSIEFDITGIDRTSILYVIRSAYKVGYDEIKLRFKTPQAIYYRFDRKEKVISVIHEEVNRLVGIEVVQQKEDFCIIKDISDPSPREFDNILRKVFLILNDASNDLIEAIEKNDAILLETIEEKHNSVTKFISYCLRLLNKRNKGGKDLLLYHILSNLDKIMDALKYSARDINAINTGLKKETIKVLRQIAFSITKYHELFYKFDFSKVSSLYENRDNVIREIIRLSKKHPRKELLILEKAAAILELITDLTEAKMGLENY